MTKRYLTNEDINNAPIGTIITNGKGSTTRVSKTEWLSRFGADEFTVHHSRVLPTTETTTLTGKKVIIVNSEWVLVGLGNGVAPSTIGKR